MKTIMMEDFNRLFVSLGNIFPVRYYLAAKLGCVRLEIHGDTSPDLRRSLEDFAFKKTLSPPGFEVWEAKRKSRED